MSVFLFMKMNILKINVYMFLELYIYENQYLETLESEIVKQIFFKNGKL